MSKIKLTNGEARLMQALRAGPMMQAELQDRFPGGYPMQKLIKLGLVQNGEFGYLLTEAGKQLCPTRRSTEKAEHLPVAPAKSAKPATPVSTISLNSTLTIKQPEVIMPIQTGAAAQIREMIKSKPGITQNEIVTSITGTSTPDEASAKKIKDMLSYVTGQGNFTKRKQPDENGDMVNCYYSDHDNVKRAQTQPQETAQPVQANIDEADIKAFTGTKERAEQAQLESRAPSALEVQEGGSHYKQMAIQPIQYIMANNIGYIEGNVIKYVSRHKNKNGIEDLKKARHYLDILIENATA